LKSTYNFYEVDGGGLRAEPRPKLANFI